MIERPNLNDDQIAAGLRDAYGLAAETIEFLPLGNDATAWVFRVQAAGGEPYFLKVKKGAAAGPGLSVPHFLRERGLTQVVAPLPARSGALAAPLDPYSLILYPYIDGVNGMSAGLSAAQWRELGGVLRRIHGHRLEDAPAQPILASVPVEAFRPPWGAAVRRVHALVEDNRLDGPFQQALAPFWREKSADVLRILARAEEIGRQLRSRTVDFRLCHADIHTANVMLDRQGGLHIVDWDGAVFAPIERDLMFIIEPSGHIIVRSEEEEAFFTGYGETPVDPLAMAYYRCEWVIQDVGDYAERIFFDQEGGDETMRKSLEGLMEMFSPGNVVEGAMQYV